MLRHVVLFRFKPEARPEQKERLAAGLAALPAQIPALRAYRFGADLGLVPGNFDFAITADVDDAAGLRAYLDHPARQKLVTELARPILAERAAVQFDLAP